MLGVFLPTLYLGALYLSLQVKQCGKCLSHYSRTVGVQGGIIKRGRRPRGRDYKPGREILDCSKSCLSFNCFVIHLNTYCFAAYGRRSWNAVFISASIKIAVLTSVKGQCWVHILSPVEI